MNSFTPIGLDKDDLMEKFRVLSQKYSLEILCILNENPMFMKELARKTKIPYTTVQKRINDLERANLVQVINEVCRENGKAIKKVRVSRFHFELNMNVIREIMENERGSFHTQNSVKLIY